ncbi:hypothetical protein Pelo_18151 [Pelomyxa schiedti]|nr:hypothetical protein Pelo_18151 [Pelomyxa schiedti]
MRSGENDRYSTRSVGNEHAHERRGLVLSHNHENRRLGAAPADRCSSVQWSPLSRPSQNSDGISGAMVLSQVNMLCTDATNGICCSDVLATLLHWLLPSGMLWAHIAAVCSGHPCPGPVKTVMEFLEPWF